METALRARFALISRLAIATNTDIPYRDNTTTPNVNIFWQFRDPSSFRDFLSRHSQFC